MNTRFKKIEKKSLKTPFFKKEKKRGIIHIKCCKNNTFFTLTDMFGGTVGWSSGGVVGFRHSRKSTVAATQKSIYKISKYAKDYGYSTITLKVKGLSGRQQRLIRPILRVGCRIQKIINKTAIPFNGCRTKRKGRR